MTHSALKGFTMLTAGCWCLAGLALGQTMAGSSVDRFQPGVKYDVVSVRPAGPDPDYRGARPAPDGTEIIFPVRDLVAYAYNIRPEFVFGGPKWAETTLFDIKAKVEDADVPMLGKFSPEERASLLAPVLASRFRLKVHTEVRVLAVYDLLLAGKDVTAPNFTPHSGKKTGFGMAVAGDNFSGTGVSLPQFTKVLSRVLADVSGRPVVDKTGLQGTYDFILRWQAPGNQADPSSTRPDIFTAIKEQLGLKLQPAKEAVSTMVIDYVDLPSVN